MAKFKASDKPVEGLTALKKYMEEQTLKMESAPNNEERDQFLVDTLSEYSEKMGSLSTIYKEGDEEVEKLKVEVRQLYEPLSDLFNQKYPLKLVGEVRTDLEKQRKRREVEQLNLEPCKLESEAQRSQQYEGTFKKIDEIIENLSIKIAGVDKHKYKKAYEVADTLIANLLEARVQYETDLRENKISSIQARNNFKSACQLAIDSAKPVLEKDLGWGDYLKNLMKCLANAVITVVSLGFSRGFFTYARSESIQAVEQAEKDLELEQTTPSCCK
ncbi:hypothetical protein EP47_07520 [Legionella norrlandica]|uniref:Type IV secretion protein Dot n=1 Tax=Legionella norrlandica TaxID=1498499 RepID=A0A0A2SUH9_9GAMM|nr:hypothetical protein [Legionella norrlandica]KGP63104.1 hypothetical protein EP47_07520 [Legionella norrlandica]